MEDLSSLPLARTSLVAGSSMAAGNTVNTHAREDGMAAPGSEPVDPLPVLTMLDDPDITISVEQPVPTTLVNKGARSNSQSYSAAPMSWKPTGA